MAARTDRRNASASALFTDWRSQVCQTAAMTGAAKISLEGALTVVCGRQPTTTDGFRSERLQVLHWQLDENASDPAPHSHQASDEVYIVLSGSIDVVVEEDRIHVGPNEALVVGAGVVHAVVAVQYPARRLTVRGPSIPDKQSAPRQQADTWLEGPDASSGS